MRGFLSGLPRKLALFSIALIIALFLTAFVGKQFFPQEKLTAMPGEVAGVLIGKFLPAVVSPITPDNVKAQVTSPYQDIQGEVRVSGNTFLGLGSTSNPLVGIGITNPAVTGLHINNIANANAYLKLTNPTTGITGADGFDLVSGNDSKAYLIQRENADMVIRTNNTDRMTIAAAGNVGIGTAPSSTLTVTGGDNAIRGTYGRMIQSRDEWLRLNDDDQGQDYHTNGVYVDGPGMGMQGGLVVGGSSIPGAGSITATGNITATGYSYANNSMRLGEIWSAGGLYRSGGEMFFGTTGNAGWRFRSDNNERFIIGGSDGNIYMGWLGDWISNRIGQDVRSTASPTFQGLTAMRQMAFEYTNVGAGSYFVFGNGEYTDGWARLTNWGNYANGYHNLAVGAFYAGGAQRFDLAEITPVNPFEKLRIGELVSTDPTVGVRLHRTKQANDSALVGIVSNAVTASMTIGGDTQPQDAAKITNKKPIALAGRVVTIVNLEGGKINTGDTITSSSTPGTGMKQTKAGAYISKTMEPFDGTNINSEGVQQIINHLKNEIGNQTENDKINYQIALSELTSPLPPGTGRIITFVDGGFYDPNMSSLSQKVEEQQKQIDALKAEIEALKK